jgi:uncharacterized protein (UPF0548 family)
MRLVRRRHLSAMLARYGDADFTYEPVGATKAELPAGYAHTRRRVRIGTGAEAFDKACDALLSWDMHRRCGLEVAADGPAEVGRTVVFGLGIGVLLVVPCRVVYVVDESRRRGFAYGTLPDHPEQGEEAFVVTQYEDASVWFDITVYSRPGAALVRWAGPIAKVIQSRATTRYVKALASFVV